MNAQQDQFGNYTPIQTPQAGPIAGDIGIIVIGSGNPTGTTGLPNSFFFDSVGLTYYFTANGTTWTAISGGGGGGAVTQILAGTNVTISPIGGTGAVTINSSGGTAQVFSANYGGVAPVFTPTTSVAIAVDTSDGTQYNYYSGAWH